VKSLADVESSGLLEERVINIIRESKDGKYGTADFEVEEAGQDLKGQLQFRIVNRKVAIVLDPFSGTNTEGYSKLRSLLEFELRKRGHID
jgi:hypothetical protein